MVVVSSLLNSNILFVLSGIHVYWALSGKWGFAGSLPENNGRKVLNPRWFDTLFVAGTLAAMALFYLYKLGWLPVAHSIIPNWLNQYGFWPLAGLFFLRAMGEFHYVGLFKKVNNSRFAELDTIFYSPLYLLLSLNTLLLLYLLPEQ